MLARMHASDWVLVGVMVGHFLGLFVLIWLDPKGVRR